MYYMYGIIRYKYKPLRRIFVLCLPQAFVMIRGIGYWTFEWRSKGWSIIVRGFRYSAWSKMGAFVVKKKKRVTGYWIADGQTDVRSVRTSGRTEFNTIEILTDTMWRQMAALLYDALTLQYVAPTQVRPISLLRERYSFSHTYENFQDSNWTFELQCFREVAVHLGYGT
jgi:hypothetical protein